MFRLLILDLFKMIERKNEKMCEDDALDTELVFCRDIQSNEKKSRKIPIPGILPKSQRSRENPRDKNPEIKKNPEQGSATVS